MRAKVAGGFRSKTMWFGFLVMAATWLANNTSVIQDLVPDQYDELAGYAIGIVIWVLRYVTTQPLEEKGVDVRKVHPPAKREPTVAQERWDNELGKELDDF